MKNDNQVFKIVCKLILLVMIISVQTLDANTLDVSIEKSLVTLNSKRNTLDAADYEGKRLLTIKALGSTLSDLVEEAATHSIGKDLTKLSNYTKLRRDYIETFYNTMYKAKSKNSMKSILNVLSDKSDEFDKLERSIVNNTITKKTLSDFSRSTAVVGKGLSIIGLASSIYGTIKDLSNDDSGGLKVSKGIYNAYSIVDAGIGIYSVFGLTLPYAKNVWVSALSSSSVAGANLSIAVLQLESAWFVSSRDEIYDSTLKSIGNRFFRLEGFAYNDIDLLLSYTFDENTNDLSFENFYKDEKLYINGNEIKTFYEELSTEFVKTKFGKDIKQITKYEKAYLLFLGLDTIYNKRAALIAKEILNISKEGVKGVNIAAGFLGQGFKTFETIDQTYNLFHTKLSIELELSRKVAYASLFNKYLIDDIARKGEIIEKAKQAIYDKNNPQNKSYHHSLPSGMSYTISFEYDSPSRIDKCMTRAAFEDSLSYVMGKGIKDPYDTTNNDFVHYSLGEPSRIINIQEALYLLDLYSKEQLKSIKYGTAYDKYQLRPKGKFMLQNIYKKVWYKKYNKLGLPKYVKRQFIQMQGGFIGYEVEDMNALNQCLTGYKAVDFIKNYDDTLWFYAGLYREGNK